ncbi:MAG: ribonuclease HI family protein [Acidobacteriota bacterium]
MSTPLERSTPPATVWVDGGSRGNPGEAGAGVVLDLGGERQERHTLYLGRGTNNEAEYAALLAALERLVALGVEEVRVFSDSQLLVRQMNGQYKVKAENLRPLWSAARQLASSFRHFSIGHIARGANAAADALANQAMDSRSSTLPVPRQLLALRRSEGHRQERLPLDDEGTP